MKSWRSRIATAAVVCAAAVTIPLTAGSASAATDPDGFHFASGTRTHDQCQEEGQYDLKYNGYTEFQCRWNGTLWESGSAERTSHDERTLRSGRAARRADGRPPAATRCGRRAPVGDCSIRHRPAPVPNHTDFVHARSVRPGPDLRTAICRRGATAPSFLVNIYEPADHQLLPQQPVNKRCC
ncbi:hypothetical protein NKH18_28365 [Streptomyces sp. M10(2022)]